VNEHFQIVEGPMTANVSIDKIALHHYVLKSEEVRPACQCQRMQQAPLRRKIHVFVLGRKFFLYVRRTLQLGHRAQLLPQVKAKATAAVPFLCPCCCR
jgi:hypothetical protein